MITHDAARFHKLYGPRKPRLVYYKKDFLDYVVMTSLSAAAIILSYGTHNLMSAAGLALCVVTIFMFVIRHGVELTIPLIIRRPYDLVYLFAYKLQNLKSVYFMAVSLLVLENVLIAATPNLPHHSDLMRKIALDLFYLHFLGITAYRTVILLDHLAKKNLVREVLRQTAWQRSIKEKTNITVEIVHAYCTGVLTHIVLIAPWYIVITHARFSVLFLAVALAANVAIHLKWTTVLNAWFYRDHWLGHNSEFEFVFLHGTHHDAIPSGLIAVAENGFLEGFLRHSIGFPSTFYSPIFAFLAYSYDVKIDIDTHQYIPGIFPKMSRDLMHAAQHSTHHYGALAPYSIGLKFDHPSVSEEFRRSYKATPEALRNSVNLDEDLSGFKWDNPTYRQILSLYDRYHN
jgi:hypothetical protein